MRDVGSVVAVVPDHAGEGTASSRRMAVIGVMVMAVITVVVTMTMA